MAQKTLFMNAFPNDDFPTGYDRNYNADDFSDWLAQVIETGVFKDGGLQVTNGTGLSVNVSIGSASIKGKGYKNTSTLNLTLPTAPTGSSSRYDLIVLRMNNVQTISGRTCEVIVVEGDSSVPTISDLTRTNEVYDLLLAYVEVTPNATSIAQADITDQRGVDDVCPYVTCVKGYNDYYDAIIQQFESNVTLQSSSAIVVTDIPSNLYLGKYSLVEVYTNGLKEENENFVVGTSEGYITITFETAKNAGAQISVILNNFIQGEGMSTAIADYTQWVQDVATLKAKDTKTYLCNGSTDNVQISNIVNEFINGDTANDSSDDYNCLNLKIIGDFGYTAYAGGSGTSSSPRRLFDIATGTRRVTLDFSNCSQVNVEASGEYVNIFNAKNLVVKGLSLVANGTTSGTIIKVFSSTDGEIVCEDCKFWLNAYQSSMIAQTGTFTNCRGSVTNVSGNSYCFQTSGSGIIRINGGEYLSYTGDSSARSAVVGQSSANAVAILYGVSAPTKDRAGYYQTNSIYQVNSNGNWLNCTDLISEKALSVVTGYSNIRGTIALSK